MPRAPKVCSHKDCTELVHGDTRCPQHKTHRWGKGDPRTTDPRHKAWRKTVLDRDHWRCQIRYPGCIGEATIADHILAVKLGGAEHDIQNGQAACRPCSDKKSSDEGHKAAGHTVRPREQDPTPHPQRPNSRP
ncbi:Bacteriophage protein [Mycobacteroides abscessus subsp. abscessus]|uniref:Bacteriophage protein n=1 Tax=Mycobacteroides abscessus TaxID=36809 RepID=A0AB33T130_9MYCO|nr:Bacteriophage protein [Mycobacteroides abscessus]SIE38053.1 Bacteriophage protein [Mycobacteroides abscessus subsp. abscessus]CPT20626.1 Bacteriophage protein [Mycobacteroides abscessus]CPT25334.1 Bacteriophage protein [Mycobacteroides abscessus]CPU73591.1 Bacteriophage protein [Mycobacteroides abscessus]